MDRKPGSSDRGRELTGRGKRRSVFGVEVLEGRALMTAQAANHVLLLSVDGLHQADVQDPALVADLTTLRGLMRSGVSYGNASTTSPSDSFPGTLAYLTGAHPGTTGVFYDVSYDRTLFAPGSNPATSTPGATVVYDETADKNLNLLSGGGNFDASGINPANLPVDAKGNPVYPSSFLKVNTIFNVARDAGLRTAFSDKHPSYQIAAGTNGSGLNDFYAPEIAASVALLNPATGKTVSADALLAANPFTDVGPYKLVDASTDPLGANDPNLELTTNNTLLTEKYDDLKVQAIVNEIDGLNSRGTAAVGVPNLFGMNFQAVSVAQKYYLGGITPVRGRLDAPSTILQAAMAHTDASLNQIVSALKGQGLWGTTMLVVTAKHGQDPRVGVGGLLDNNTVNNVLAGAGVKVAQATQDDVSLIWLQNQGQTSAAVAALKQFQRRGTLTVAYQGTTVTLPASQVIDRVISGPGLPYHKQGDPLLNSRTPDVIVTLKTGFIWVGNQAHYQYKRAEHGGFSVDDTHVPLVLAGGLVHSGAHAVSTPVQTTQIAVTSLLALGLDPNQLQGAVIEGTRALPGLRGH